MRFLFRRRRRRSVLGSLRPPSINWRRRRLLPFGNHLGELREDGKEGYRPRQGDGDQEEEAPRCKANGKKGALSFITHVRRLPELRREINCFPRLCREGREGRNFKDNEVFEVDAVRKEARREPVGADEGFFSSSTQKESIPRRAQDNAHHCNETQFVSYLMQ